MCTRACVWVDVGEKYGEREREREREREVKHDNGND